MASLKTYHAKRDFSVTGEPRGGKAAHKTARKGSAFVIQKHDATRLHYDLRLELDGVMLSWAVTRGPSLVPGEKRLAIHVEDHPIEYNTFEGTIPQGQYGGGTVMVWDRGKWFPEHDPHRGMQKGHLDFRLEGKKLRGNWHLVRMRKRPGERQEPWLLIKSDDEFARGPRDPDILEQEPNSVKTGRSLDEIANAHGRVWNSNRGAQDPKQDSKRARKQAGAKAKSAARSRTPVAKASKSRSKAKATASKVVARKAGTPKSSSPNGSAARSKKEGGAKNKSKKRKPPLLDLERVAGARQAERPDFIAPCLATLSAAAPASNEWVHEIKFDGYRIQAHIDHGRVRLLTRNNLDWTARFKPVAAALSALNVESAILDGEIVVEEKDGIPSFSALQEMLKSGGEDFIYYLFDLLYLDGYDLTGAALTARKHVLKDVLAGEDRNGILRFSEDFATAGSQLLHDACGFGLEGIVSKRAEAPYRSGRGGDWLKTKCSANQEFIIAGYEPSTTNSRTIRALILAYYDKNGLHYAGRVGTGFNARVERDLVGKLNALRADEMPFAKLPAEERPRKVKWVKPRLVAEIDFRGWTHGNVLRQASFKGLREDKQPEDVVREKMVMRTAAMRSAVATKTAPAKTPAKSQKVFAKAKAVSYAGVTLSHPDRVYWDDVGITKRDLAEYYMQVWKWMAPHLKDRPIAMVRCPEGATAAKCFFQKHASAGLETERLKSVPIPGEEPMVAVEDLSGLIALAQAGVLEIHTWGTVADEIDTCNRLVFDLDPGPGISFAQLKEGAREVRARMEALKLKSFLKTTGGKGLHVVVPIAPADWDHAKDFAHAVADAMAADKPDRYVSNMAKRLREHRIFVDYLRNARGATAIAPFSTRARPGATVSVPIAWEELGKLSAPNHYTVQNVLKRLNSMRRDPWANIGRIKQRLPEISALRKGARRGKA